jgi:hypothetical protein
MTLDDLASVFDACHTMGSSTKFKVYHWVVSRLTLMPCWKHSEDDVLVDCHVASSLGQIV